MGPGSASRESSAPPVIPGISFRSITVLPFSTPVIVLDLDLVSAAEIDAAVASLRHHDLDVELEVLECRFGHEVRSRILVHERPVFHFPAVRLRSVPREPALQPAFRFRDLEPQRVAVLALDGDVPAAEDLGVVTGFLLMRAGSEDEGDD